jgi:hypothetical protein
MHKSFLWCLRFPNSSGMIHDGDMVIRSLGEKLFL